MVVYSDCGSIECALGRPEAAPTFVDFGGLWRLPGVASSFWSSCIFSGKNTVAYLRRQLGERDLGELTLDIAVTNLATVAPEILRSGPFAETVMASCAVPGLFTIQTIRGERYFDGGIAAEFPCEHFIDDPAIDIIIIHRIGHEQGSRSAVKWDTVSSAMSMAHNISSNELHRMRGNLAASRGKKFLEITTTPPFPGLFSNRLAPTCYDHGHQSGRSITETFRCAQLMGQHGCEQAHNIAAECEVRTA